MVNESILSRRVKCLLLNRGPGRIALIPTLRIVLSSTFPFRCNSIEVNDIRPSQLQLD